MKVLHLKDHLAAVGGVEAHLLGLIPRCLLRGMLKTPSSQPVSAILKANRSLLKLVPRLLNEEGDQTSWRNDLIEMKWPWSSN